MWYVVQVRTGTEESVRKQYEKLFREVPKDQMMRDQPSQDQCFIPYYERMKRYQGAWHKERSILFPGYVFLVSDDLERVKNRLQQVIGLTKLLGIEDMVIPLNEKEIRFMTRFGGDDHVVEVSKGIVEGTQVIVTEGPLQGWEGLIVKLDRHKRKAWLEVQMFGRMQRVEVGLEIMEKKRMEE